MQDSQVEFDIWTWEVYEIKKVREVDIKGWQMGVKN